LTAIDLDEALVREIRERAIHALTGRADHGREFALRVPRLQPNVALAVGRRLAGERGEAGREPSSDIKEVQLPDVATRAPYLVGQTHEHRLAKLRVGIDQITEGTSG